MFLNFNNNIKIELNRRKLIFNEGVSKEKIIKPSNEDWAKFLLKLDKLDIWNWDLSYQNHYVLDGNSWHLDIISGSKSIKSNGANAYPENFQAFLEALESLLKIDLNILRNQINDLERFSEGEL